MQLIYKIILLALVASTSFALNKVGNGGDGILCKSESKGESLQLLDFYETKNPFTSDLKDPKDILKVQLVKLEQAAPKLARQYIKRLDGIMNDIEFTDEKLVDIQDSNHLIKPADPDCKLVQLAIRKNLATQIEKTFLFQKSHWKKLSPVQKAGLLSHEIIYEHLYKLGELDSIKARKINSMIFSDYSKSKFWELVHELRLSIYP